MPAWCRTDFRIALYPGVSAKSASEEIEQKVAELTKADAFLSKSPPIVTWNGFFSEGYVLEPGSDAESILAKAHKTATGEELKTGFSGAYLDARVHSLYDKIPALSYGKNLLGIIPFTVCGRMPYRLRPVWVVGHRASLPPVWYR